MEMKDFFRYYSFESDETRANWVADRRVGPKNTLHAIVPAGFSRYARALHPGWWAESLDPSDEKAWDQLRAGWRDAENLLPVRWDDTAEKWGRQVNRLSQWSDITTYDIREPGEAGIDPPLEGQLTKEMMESFFQTFFVLSGEEQKVICGFWEGCAAFDTSQAKAKLRSYCGEPGYVLFNSTVSKVREGWLAALEYSTRKHGIGTDGLTPNAVWPTTREWYLAVDYSLQSTYIGGSEDLIDSLCASANLEIYQVFPGDKVS